MPVPITKNRAFLAAYERGRTARYQNMARNTCPPPDLSTGYHVSVVTFSRAFIRFWREGWDDMDRELDQPKDA